MAAEKTTVGSQQKRILMDGLELRRQLKSRNIRTPDRFEKSTALAVLEFHMGAVHEYGDESKRNEDAELFLEVHSLMMDNDA